jgi:hypothetical protein
VALLESEVGFAPVSEVKLEGRGRLVRRSGDLVLDVGGRRNFIVQAVEAATGAPPENEDLAIVAVLADPRSPDRVVVREWTKASKPAP